jgi:hypothetical protein
LARATLAKARRLLSAEDVNKDPLEWWPQHAELGAIHSLARMFLAIPATSADDERVFSSAGFTLNQRRTRLGLDNFRREHRIRQFLRGGTLAGTLMLGICFDFDDLQIDQITFFCQITQIFDLGLIGRGTRSDQIREREVEEWRHSSPRQETRRSRRA